MNLQTAKPERPRHGRPPCLAPPGLPVQLLQLRAHPIMAGGPGGDLHTASEQTAAQWTDSSCSLCHLMGGCQRAVEVVQDQPWVLLTLGFLIPSVTSLGCS